MFDESASSVVAVDEEIALQPNLRNPEAAGCNSVSWWNVSAKVSECSLQRLSLDFVYTNAGRK